MIEPLATLDVEALSGRKGRWRLALFPDHLEIVGEDRQEVVRVGRDELSTKAVLREHSMLGALLHVRMPKNVAFKLAPEAVAAFKEWRGPLTTKDLSAALRQRLRWATPVAVIYVLVSLPMAGDPELGIDPVALDWIGICFGIALVALAMAVRWWPRRTLFLFDGLWFSALALDLVIDVLLQGSSVYWLVLVAVVLLAASGGFGEYRRFAELDEEESVR